MMKGPTVGHVMDDSAGTDGQLLNSYSHERLSNGVPSVANLPKPSSSSTGVFHGANFPQSNLNKHGPKGTRIGPEAAVGFHPGAVGDRVNLLLPPTHFASPASANGDHSMPYHSVSSGHGMNHLENLDLSSSKFMDVVNFEELSGGSNRATGSPENVHVRLYPGMQDFVDYHSAGDGDSPKCGGSEEKRPTTRNQNVDLLEQQQAKAQAQLLDRFKQLREWQVAQQEILMRQQQDQLALLKQEQTRVQRMLVKQREAQWGGQQAIHQKPNSPPHSPQKKPHHHHHTSTLPQALAQGTLAMAKKNRPQLLDESVDDSEAVPRPSTPVQVVKGRPLPGIVSGPSTPLEYRERGNPDLDSETNTVAMGTPYEDGVARLAETASETSDDPGYFHSSAEKHSDMDSALTRQIAESKYGMPIPFKAPDPAFHQNSSSTLTHPVPSGPFGQFNLPAHMLPKQLPRQMYSTHTNHSSMTHKNLPVNRETQPHTHPSHSPSAQYPTDNVQNEVLDFREEQFSEEEDYDSDNNSCVDVLKTAKLSSPKDMSAGNESPVSITEEEPQTLDNVPVAGTKKTFEQLLEEELQKEQEKLQRTSEPAQDATRNSASKAKTFLKRGEGIARFSAAPKKATSGRRRSKQGHKNNQGQTVGSSKHQSFQSNKVTNKAPETLNVAKKKALLVSRKTVPAKKASPVTKASIQSTRGKDSQKLNEKSKSKRVENREPHKKQPDSVGDPGPSKEMNHNPVASTAIRDSTGEISFQQCMQQRVETEEVESEELEEFMILEQYADDNASFLSNVSVVNRVLEKDKKQTSHDSQSVASKEMSKECLLSVAEHSIPDNESDDDDDDNSQNVTLEEAPHEASPQIPRDSPQSNKRDNLSQEHAVLPRTINRKVASLENRSPPKPETAILPSREDSRDTQESSDKLDHNMNTPGLHYKLNPVDSSESEEESTSSESEDEIDVKDIILNAKPQRTNSVKHISASDKVSSVNSPDKASLNGTSENLTGESLRQIENKLPVSAFEDDDEWEEDNEENVCRSSASKARPDPVTKTKVYPELEDEKAVNGTPPTSKLVTKLFPKLKAEKPKPKVTEEQQQKLSEARQTLVGDGVQSKALREKLGELEQEIERFRRENATLEKLRLEREQGLDHIKKEMAEFEKQKQDELQRLQEFKAEETRKLKKEKKLFEQYQKATKAMPDRKEREEIESLKSQVADLQEEIKRKEQRWTASSKRLRDRIETLEDENSELKEELKLMEKRRLEAWQEKEKLEASRKDGLHQSSSHVGQMQTPAPQPPSQPDNNNKTTSAVSPHHNTVPHPALGHSLVPQPHSQAGLAQSKEKAAMQHGDNILRLSCNTDDSEMQDSTPHSAVPHDDSLNTSVTPQPSANKRFTSSPISPTSRNPPTSHQGLPRKTALATNISSAVDKGDEKYEELQHTDGKIERIYTNGAREILFSNGTRKQVSADGQSIIVSFFNGDIKQILPDQRVVYYYADAKTTHTNYPDGLEVIQFANGQSEKHYPDGTKEITFPDQIIKYLFPTGIEESVFPDGTVIRVEKNGDKLMEFPNGQREVHTSQYKRREYPDGTVKTVYPDGRQETRYSSGRIRVKDKEGNIIVDRRM